MCLFFLSLCLYSHSCLFILQLCAFILYCFFFIFISLPFEISVCLMLRGGEEKLRLNKTWHENTESVCLICAQNCPHSAGCDILSRHCVNILLLCLKEVGGKSIYVPSHREENFVDGCKNLKLLWHASSELKHSYFTFQIIQASMIMM